MHHLRALHFLYTVQCCHSDPKYQQSTHDWPTWRNACALAVQRPFSDVSGVMVLITDTFRSYGFINDPAEDNIA